MNLAVDHAVINVLHSMDAAVPRFSELGFTLTPRGYHSLGSINHLMVFGRDYLELVGLPHGDGPLRREVADSPLGLNGLVFATANADTLHRDLARRGIAAQPPLAFDRPVEVDGAVRKASFRTVRLDGDWVHGGRVYFCQHDTPELVWRTAWQVHRNGVYALAGMTIAVPDPRREAVRYTVLGGNPVGVTAEREDQVLIAIGDFTLCLVTPARYATHYGSLACDSGGRTAFMGALALRTGTLGKVRECLAESSTSHEQSTTRITLPASLWFNTVVEFVE